MGPARVASAALLLVWLAGTASASPLAAGPLTPVAEPGTCGAGPQPGPSPLRRLTRFEYDGTVADLLGDRSGAARHFPEEGGSGFDNNADVAVATRIHAQKYMSAAEAIAARATEDLPALLGCDPRGRGEAACVRRWLERFATRAWRRPLDRAEMASLWTFYRQTRASGPVRDAVRTTIEALLESPNFLYKVEVGRPVPGHPGVFRLADHEVAARLSYFLWGSMPDEALFRAAARGELRTPAQVAAQARRMLADPRARVTLRRFHDQWLGLSLLERMQKEKVPGFTREIPPLMRRQFERFVDYALWEADGRLETLLTSPVTFLNGPLASFLGVAGVTGDAFVKVEAGGAARAGILTLPGFLAMQSTVRESSPIKRGLFVREQLLCQIPPPPPANMQMLELPGPSRELVTLRDRLEDHRSDVACAKCHRLFDPLGLAFEHFDTVGAYRQTDEGRPVDATGKIVESDVDGEFDDAAGMAARLARSAQVRGCMIRQWFRFAFGRTESAADACTLGELVRRFEASGHHIPQLLVDLTQTDTFLYRRAEDAPTLSSR